MKWFYLIMSYAVKWFENAESSGRHLQIEKLKELVRENFLKILLAFSIVTALSSFFVAGICLTMLDLAGQYYKADFLKLGSFSVVGLSLIVFSILIYLIAYFYATKNDRLQKKMAQTNENTAIQSTINDAIILLINDYVAERQFKRQQSQKPQQQPNMPDIKSSELFERH